MLTDILLAVLIGLCLFLIREQRKVKKLPPPAPTPPSVTYNQTVDLAPIKKLMDEVPFKVLETIKGSTNNLKGDLGEMIGYIKLHASYDKIIPLGNIVDFMAIRFEREGTEGCVDFIDIKTGKARLSKDQRDLQKLINDKKINFIKLKVETSKNESDSD